MDDNTPRGTAKTYLIADTTVELLKGRLAAELGKTPKTLRYDLKMCKPSNKNTGKCVWLVSAWARRTEVDSQGEKHTYQNEAGAFYVVMMPEGATKVRVALASVDQGVDDIRAARGDYDASLTVWELTRRIDWNQIRPPEHPGAALLTTWLEDAKATPREPRGQNFGTAGKVREAHRLLKAGEHWKQVRKVCDFDTYKRWCYAVTGEEPL